MPKQSSPDTRSREPGRTNRILAALGILVLFLLATLLILQLAGRFGPGSPGAPDPETSLTGSAETSDSAYTSETALLTEPSGSSETTADPADPGSSGEDLNRAIPLTLKAAEEIPLPENLSDGAFNLLHILPDGRLILQNAQAIVIFDPETGSSITAALADFGLQGAANDRFIVYGVGGDEVFAIDVYTIGSGQVSRILEDEVGYFGFELDRDNQFYTTKVEALKYGKVPGDWLRYDLVSGSVAKPGEVRSQAALELKAIWPDAGLDWAYETGHVWHEPALLTGGTLFTLKLEYSDIARDLYNYELLRTQGSKAQGEGAFIMQASGKEAVLPQIRTAGPILVYNDIFFYDEASEEWYEIRDDGSSEMLSLIGLSGDRNTVWLASRGPSGRFMKLYRARR